MRSRVLIERVDMALQRASVYRAQGDGVGCLDLLAGVFQDVLQAEQDRLTALVGWRFAKAQHDFGDAASLCTTMEAMLELPDPLEGHPAGLSAIPAITMRVWREIGYGRDVIEDLWDLWTSRQLAANEPYLAAHGQIQRAWQLGCRGDLDGVLAISHKYLKFNPDHMVGPHKHPQASTPGDSLFFVQMDLTRTCLRCGNWAKNDRYARDAYESYLDASDEAGCDPNAVFWFLEPAHQAAVRFGWREVDALERPYREALAVLNHPRRDYHLALADRDYSLAVTLAQKGGYGAEWVAYAHQLAGNHASVVELADRYGVRVFLPT